MIARHWRGLAKSECGDDYIEHLQTETFPRLATLQGFVSASIWKRDLVEGTEFLIVTVWTSLEAVAQFAGPDVESAVVPDEVQRLMIEWDSRARHYEVVKAVNAKAE
jgi:heme-degrading monooxygenase HmoA